MADKLKHSLLDERIFVFANGKCSKCGKMVEETAYITPYTDTVYKVEGMRKHLEECNGHS